MGERLQQVQEQFFLGSDYENIRFMDEGGMGTLYRAHKKGLDVEVVIKKVKSKYKGYIDEGSEANILKHLKHKYLPRVYDIIRAEDGYSYTVMDYIEGCNLKQYIEQNGAQNEMQVRKWALQLTEVIAYLHEQEKAIIHCDIKPGNIMITANGDICVIDFNTSLVFVDGALALGATQGFAAPEQYTKPDLALAYEKLTKSGTTSQASFTLAQTMRAGGFGSITKRTDVYSIGATMYYMLTGCAPQHSLSEITPLSAYNIKLGQALKDVIECAMQQNPSKRFADALTMNKALQALHKQDGRYKRLQVQKKLAMICVMLLYTAGIALTVYGVITMRTETEHYYQNLIETGIALSEQSEYKGSYEYLSQAMLLCPKRIEAYNGVAVLLYKQAKYEECISFLEKTLRDQQLQTSKNYETDFANISYILGSCYMEQQNYKFAEQQFEVAVLYNPQIAVYYRDLAIVQARTGKLEAAQQTLNKMAETGKDENDVLMVKAEIINATGDYEQALALFEQVYRFSADVSTVSRAYLMAAETCQYLGNEMIDKEIGILEQACNVLDSTHNSLHMQRLASAYVRKGDSSVGEAEAYYQKAIACYDKLIAQGYDIYTVSQNLAIVQMNMGDYQSAEKTLLELEQMYPENYKVYTRLALLYAGWEATKNVNARDYTKTKENAILALEYYEKVANNVGEDNEIIRLNSLIEQLKAAGWI